MKGMNCSDVFPWQRRVVVAVAMSVGGCSSFNPYQRSHRVDVPVRQLAAEEKGKHSAIEALAGGLHGATGALKDQRKEWYDSLSSQARIRYATQFGLIGLTAVALYGGLKSGVASDNDKKRLALAGAAGFAAYSGSTWFVNAGQEHAYIEGIRELTCAMMNIEPLRVSEKDFGRMEDELKALNKAINHLDDSILKAEARYRYPRDSESAGAHVRHEAMAALKRARQTLTSSWQLHDQINNSGVVLMREGDLVFARVASRINDAQKDIAPPDALAGQGVGIIKSFRSVKIDTVSESDPPPAVDAGRRIIGKRKNDPGGRFHGRRPVGLSVLVRNDRIPSQIHEDGEDDTGKGVPGRFADTRHGPAGRTSRSGREGPKSPEDCRGRSSKGEEKERCRSSQASVERGRGGNGLGDADGQAVRSASTPERSPAAFLRSEAIRRKGKLRGRGQQDGPGSLERRQGQSRRCL
ncbi:MAG TPA: hypothetical protein VMR43_05810 [Variovorax sp.]|nr:hypothetical protein [Variovorax sp.]